MLYIHAVTWIFSVVIAFSFMSQWEEELPIQATAAVSVGEWDRSVGAGELYAEFKRFAQQEEITFAKVSNASEGWYGRRTLYAIDEDPAVDLKIGEDGTLPGFAAYSPTYVEPFDALGERTVSGPYIVFGSEEKAALFASFLAEQGLRASVNPIHRAQNYAFVFVRTLTTAFSVALLAVTVISAAGVLLSSRSYAVARLQGQGFGGILGNDLRRICKLWFAAGAFTIVGSAIALAAFNGLFAFGAYLTALVASALALSASALLAHALALKLVMDTRILDGLKGGISGRSAIVMTYTLRAVVIAIAAALTGQTLLVGADLSERERSAVEYQQLGSLSYANVGGTGGSANELEQSVEMIGEWARSQERDGNALVAAESSLSQSLSTEVAGRSMLRVNDPVADDSDLRLPDGSPYVYGRTGANIEILVPEHLSGSSATVRADIESYREIYQEDLRENLSFSVVVIASEQRVFTYSTETRERSALGAEENDASYVTDPVVVVSNSKDAVYTPAVYDSMVSQGRVYFIDPEAALAPVTADQRMSDYVLGMTSAAAAAEDNRQERARDFLETLFSLVAVVAVLVVANVGGAFLYGGRQARLVFARHINGWSLPSAHRSFIALECLLIAWLLAFPLVRVCYVNWKGLSVYRESGIPAPIAPATVETGQFVAVAALAAVAVAVGAVTLARVHRRVIRNGVSEA